MSKRFFRKNSEYCSVVLIMGMLLLCITLVGCGPGTAGPDNPGSTGGSGTSGPFEGRELVSMQSYYGLSDYDGEPRFAETTVSEIASLMDAGETFVFFASFADCPYCNSILPYLCDALTEADVTCGYLDTRKNPDWQSNLDIDDYDLFVELFGEYLEYDDEGLLHLYTPDLYFIKDGKVVAHHQGVIYGADDPYAPLTQEQEEALRSLLDEMFGKMLG